MKEVPAYPSFRPVDISQKHAFDKAFSENPPEISEYTFTNIFAWRHAYKFSVSCLGDFLLVCSDKAARPVFFDPVGAGDKAALIARVIKDTSGHFSRIPEQTIDALKGSSGFKYELDADNSDYLYLSSDLVHLKGKKYDGKRNLIKKFRSLYRYEYQGVSRDNLDECVNFVDEWCKSKDCESVQGLREERTALNDMLLNASDFGIVAGAIRVDSGIRAMALGQKLNPHTFVVHILKAYSDMAGLYQVMNNEFLSREAAGFKYINMEQDLGLEGLRKSKLSYQPVSIIKKYNLRLTA